MTMFDGILTLLRSETNLLLSPQTTCWWLLQRNVKFMLCFISLVRHDSARKKELSKHTTDTSQSSALAMAIKKFMTHFLCLFHSLFFKMHVKQTP